MAASRIREWTARYPGFRNFADSVVPLSSFSKRAVSSTSNGGAKRSTMSHPSSTGSVGVGFVIDVREQQEVPAWGQHAQDFGDALVQTVDIV